MAITLGFAIKIGSSPPAVVVAPLTQPLQSGYSAIKAEVVAGSGATVRPGIPRNDFMRQPHSFLSQQPLAYTNKGEQFFAKQELNGRLLDMFA